MLNSFTRHLLSLINKLCKGGKTMEEKDKPKKPTRPSDWVKNESKEKKNEQSEENIDAKKKKKQVLIKMEIYLSNLDLMIVH